MEDSTECVFLNTSNLSVKGGNPKVVNETFSINGMEKVVCHKLIFNVFTFEELKQEIAKLQKYAKDNKLKLSGSITIAYKEGDFVKFHNLKISMKKITELDKDIKMTTKAQTEPKTKKPKTFDEKINLIVEYCKTKGELPKSDTVFKDENIGKFWSTVSKNKSAFDKVMGSV